METNLITRKDLEDLFDSLQIQSGSIVLLQADLKNMPELIGGPAALVEALWSRIGPRGTLIVPAFTLGALDPACSHFPQDLEQWEMVRSSMPGFSSKTMPPDVWSEAANCVLLHTRMKRSEHPVYSFAWIGPAAISPALESLDFPISFSHILSLMDRKNAVNLLFNVPADQALLFEMIAHRLQADQTGMQKAWVRRVGKTFPEEFLIGVCDRQARISAMAHLDVQCRRLGRIEVYKVTQKEKSES